MYEEILVSKLFPDLNAPEGGWKNWCWKWSTFVNAALINVQMVFGVLLIIEELIINNKAEPYGHETLSD